MLAPRNQLFGGALVLLMLAGCRDFDPKGPFPCSTAGRCPGGYTCDPSANLCHPNGQKVDGSAGDASDAPIKGLDTRDGSNNPDMAGGDTPGLGDSLSAGDTNGEVSAEASHDLPPLDLLPDARRVPNGGACNQGGECQSTSCVDGICCDKACQATCQACKQIDTGEPDGTCASVSAGRDPHDQCTQTAPEKCGDTGACHGQGACQKYGTNQICAAAVCNGATFTPTGTCSGAGACVPGEPINCMQYPCSAAGGCAKTCAGDGDCLGQSYCSNGTCIAKKPSGQTCTDKRECTSGFCADGVCCESACTGTCNACSLALTNQPSGKCAAVKVGAGHGNDCSSDGTTCGTDGKCDGKGTCRFAASATVCKGESCLPGTSTYSPMSTCDGKGACIPMSQDCDRYKCTSDGVRCRSSCGADGDCTTKAYCSDGGLCVSDLAPGAICKRSEQCSSGACVGRCCPAGAACNCPQPNAANLLKNPGFDDNVLNWGTEGTFTRDSSDADGCPYSGSLLASGYPAQCVPVSGGTSYNLGFSYKHVTNQDDGPISCYVDFRDDFVCMGTAVGDNPTLGDFESRGIVPWKSLNTAITAPAAARSAVVRCVVPGNWNLDKLFLTPAPGNY